MSRWLRLLPVALLVMLVAGLVWRLANPGDQVVSSKLVGQPVPQFSLPAAIAGTPALSSSNLATGEPQLVNIFASWCVPCIAEAPLLAELDRRGATIVGIAIRDRPEDLAQFLGRHGNPFDRIGSDATSQVQLALGSAGVPDTFIIDGRGIVRHQHIGVIAPEDVPVLLRELEKAR